MTQTAQIYTKAIFSMIPLVSRINTAQIDYNHHAMACEELFKYDQKEAEKHFRKAQVKKIVIERLSLKLLNTKMAELINIQKAK